MEHFLLQHSEQEIPDFMVKRRSVPQTLPTDVLDELDAFCRQRKPEFASDSRG
jgi:hypothetical protein